MSKITKEILINSGFECTIYQETHAISKFMKSEYGIEDFMEFRRWTSDVDKKSPIKLDIDNGCNNSGRKWHLHIDNDHCETIGCADIDTVEQFNKLMEVFDSKFRLTI